MLEVAAGERDGDVEVGRVVNVGDGSVEAAREKGADLERGELFESEGDSVVGGSGLAEGCGGTGVERGARRAINWEDIGEGREMKPPPFPCPDSEFRHIKNQ